jgi:hypothetical protein
VSDDVNVRNLVAQAIRKHPNNTDAKTLGCEVAGQLMKAGYDIDAGYNFDEQDVAKVIKGSDPNHTIGAGRLADAIVDELDLDA